MKVENQIAWRYLRSKYGLGAVHVVSRISATAIGVVTAAMVCVMSVMNGFGVVVEKMFSSFDPDIQVVAESGKTFVADSAMCAALKQTGCVDMVSGVVKEMALARFEDKQVAVEMMGVDSMFARLTHIEGLITDGQYAVWDGAWQRAVLGEGLAWQLGIGAGFVDPIFLYVPKRHARVNMLRPDDNFRTDYCYIAGTFAIRQMQYDDHVMIVNIDLARELLEMQENEVSALNVALSASVGERTAKKAIAQVMGPGYKIMNRYEQQEDFFHILKIEKWLTALLLVFILLIASFNCISSLSMLMMDKKDDIRILSHLGATKGMIRNIFRREGRLISMIGAVGGLIVGLVLCLVQEHFGIIKLGTGEEYILSAYPVAVQAMDVVLVAVAVIALGGVAAWIPTRKKTNYFTDIES